LRITIKALPAIAIAIYFASFCASAAPVARLTFHSDPDDPIGRGEDVDITYAEQMASTFVTIANWQFDPSDSISFNFYLPITRIRPSISPF
jgi:hypothetical protein